jgi:general secretion pathway protein K
MPPSLRRTHRIETTPAASEHSASPAHRSARAEGFVLVIVLWWLTLLVFLTTQITSSAHTAALIAANIRGSASAEAEADGAVNEAIFQVLAQHWQADGAAHFVLGPQGAAEVRIEDEGGKIDPNVAPLALMQALLDACGAAPSTAAKLAVAISEWRSPDLRAAGTERASQYRIAGFNYVPPNTRFVSVDELGLVLGMTPQLLACIEPHVSVYSVSVPSLETTTDEVVRRALREAYPDDAMQPAAAIASEVAVIRVTATAQETTGNRFQRVAVMRIASAARNDNFAYKILSWE